MKSINATGILAFAVYAILSSGCAGSRSGGGLSANIITIITAGLNG